jgi:hypothetical protein
MSKCRMFLALLVLLCAAVSFFTFCAQEAHADASELLFAAVKSENVAGAREALDAGADIWAEEDSPSKLTPLHIASSCGHVVVMKELLRVAAEQNRLAEYINYQCRGGGQLLGRTALHMAVGGPSIDALRILLERGADPKIAGQDGATALSLAEAGIDVDSEGRSGVQARMLREKMENPTVSDLQCAICLGKVCCGEKFWQLRCRHMFHESCIFQLIDVRTNDDERGRLRTKFYEKCPDFLSDGAMSEFDAAKTGRDAALVCLRLVGWIPGIECPKCRKEICVSEDGVLRPDHPTFAAKKLCAKCSEPAASVCGRCYSIRYCSPECQRADWPRHKVECHSSSL